MITRSDLALLAVRLLALYLIVEGIASLGGVVAFWRADGQHMRAQAIWITVAMTLPMVCGAGMLVFSRTIGAWILPPAAPAGEPAPSLPAVQAVAIGTFGLFLIANAIPQAWTTYLVLDERLNEWEEAAPIYKDPVFIGNLAELALGIALFTGAAFWTRLFRKFRNLGYDNDKGKSE